MIVSNSAFEFVLNVHYMQKTDISVKMCAKNTGLESKKN